MQSYQTSIDQALAHIKKNQSLDGGFISRSGFSADDFRNSIPRSTTFFAANVAMCLRGIPGKTADIQSASARFLLKQKSEAWSFNYWTRDAIPSSRASKKIPYPPYPDDLDDTFAALAALAGYDPDIINGEMYAAIAKILIGCECVGANALPHSYQRRSHDPDYPPRLWRLHNPCGSKHRTRDGPACR